jgi:hypothetical protein
MIIMMTMHGGEHHPGGIALVRNRFGSSGFLDRRSLRRDHGIDCLDHLGCCFDHRFHRLLRQTQTRCEKEGHQAQRSK